LIIKTQLQRHEITSASGRSSPHSDFYFIPKQKCVPVLLYGLEVCPLTKAELHSLDFVVNRFLMQLFQLSSISVVKETAADVSVLNCQANFLKDGSKNLCPNVVSDHVRCLFMTHCALNTIIVGF